ncbi:YdcF family protein [Bradyrhizobium sp. Tv2a-2]|uniref:YdcF family protein n=1 Tax=Bradyrhizobium sp. Tv2a-2 TaxID=113395 RepID=UPI0003FC924A|nr:YdcF family protein [Bradyrhizobium sp. Tv2a-2]
MFFVLSKTLGVIILPTHFLLIIGLLGALLLLTRFRALGRKCLVLSIVLLAICAFSPLGNVLIYSLESRFPPWDASRGAPDGIIVLGGPIDADISVAHDAPVIRSAADRIVAGAALARKYPNARVIFTGGSPNLISNDAREADYAAMVFDSLGIDRSRLIVERRSRNTLENAEFSKALADPRPGERWLLVTSAFHMPRAVGLFRRAGFPVEPYPVDWRTGDKSDLLSFSNTATDGLLRTDIAIREWIGLIAYRLAGKTDDLLPGPSQD